MTCTAGLHPEQIKAAIRMEAGTIKAFEARHGLKSGAVADAMRKGRPHVERLIANLMGRSPEEIWPERFIRKGRKMHDRKANTSLPARARQNGEAA